MTSPCRIYLCEWVGGPDDVDEHLRKEHPTAVRAREGLARWAHIIGKDSAARNDAVEKRGREPSAGFVALPESPRVHPSRSPESAEATSRPRVTRFCVFCGRPPRSAWSSTCAGCTDLEDLDPYEEVSA